MAPDAHHRSPLFHHAMALATITIWSFSFLFIVKLNRELTPIGVVSLRMDIFAIFVAGLWLWRRPSLRGLTKREWLIVGGLSLVGGPLYHNVFSWSAGVGADGVSRIDPALLGLILATVPVHTGWLARVFLSEPLGPSRLAALALGFVGVAAVIIGRSHGVGALDATRLEGPAVAVLAAMLGGGIAVLTRGARTIYKPADLAAVSGAGMVLLQLLLHPWAHLERVSDMTTEGWIAALFLGFFGLGVAFLTWASALAGLPAVIAAMYLFLASVLAALWGWLFDATPIGWPFAIGAALVLSGLLVMAWSGGRRSTSEAAVRRAAPARPVRSG